MEMDSKKRPANSSDNRRRARPREDGEAHAAATDDEVEEFFAILRRLHAAGKPLRSRDGSACHLTEKWAGWMPAFEWEDFAGPNALNPNGAGNSAAAMRGVEAEGRRREEKGEESAAFFGRLDLNEEPEREHTAHSSGR